MFSIALGLALLGGVGFAVALSAAFGRWGTGWEDGLAFASIALLVMAALLNLLAAAMALGAIARRRRVRPWQAVSLLLAVLSLAWGVVLAGM